MRHSCCCRLPALPGHRGKPQPAEQVLCTPEVTIRIRGKTSEIRTRSNTRFWCQGLHQGLWTTTSSHGLRGRPSANRKHTASSKYRKGYWKHFSPVVQSPHPRRETLERKEEDEAEERSELGERVLTATASVQIPACWSVGKSRLGIL